MILCQVDVDVISQGPQKPSGSPNKFLPVAPLFFFPLMAPYDTASPALNLLGRDHLLLGNLVRTLGNVLWCASHSPAQAAMATALLDFVWALRYHPSRYQCHMISGIMYICIT